MIPATFLYCANKFCTKKFLTQPFLEGKQYDLGIQMWGSQELPHSCDLPLARRGHTIVGLIGS